MTAINNRLSAANDWKAEMEAKKAFLQELIKNDDLDEAALEMTKQVIARVRMALRQHRSLPSSGMFLGNS